MQVVEIFQSIQGEGTLLGAKMVFVRLWGCNMTCSWCDTRYSWAPEFKEKTMRENYAPNELASKINRDFPTVEWINFTGGEPTLWADQIYQTIDFFEEKKVCIQTNGKSWKEELFNKLDKVCMDFKCPSSGESSNLEFLTKLRTVDEAKFVVSTKEDLKFVTDVLDQYSVNGSFNPTIIIQPVLFSQEPLSDYFERIRWLVEEFKDFHVKNVRITPQYHQLLWRDIPGT